MYVEKDFETRVVISERDFYRKLSYKELRVVFEEKHSQGKKYGNMISQTSFQRERRW